jgi:PAS domain S-box-containing protein
VPFLQTDAAARRLAAIVASSDDAIISKDLNGIVQSWNASAERIFGFTEAEMVGQSILRIIPAERRGEEDQVLSRIRRGESVDHFETWRQRKDGTLIPISLTVSPVRDESGTVVGASKIARDISDRRRAEAAILKAEAERADLQRRLLTLVAASDSLVAKPDVQQVTDATLQLAQQLVAADGYVVWRGAPDEDWIPVRHLGVSQDFISLPQSGARASAPVEPLVCEDVHAMPSLAARAEAYRREGVVSMLVVPVKVRSASTGALAFYYRTPHRFSDVEVQTAMALANLAGAGIGSAELHEQERLAREEARQANSIKDQFLATLSHELRTPLNAIVGYTRMVMRGAIGAERQAHALSVVERNADALTQIVEDVLDVSRIVTGKLALRRERIDLAPLVRQATDTVLPMAEEKGVALAMAIAGAPVMVDADANRLQQVVWNLVTNAVKFTPAGGEVHVSLTTAAGQAVIRVKDTGVGISAEFLPQIFEPFRQADAQPTRTNGGLGLGLAITRRLVELHDGTIAATSGDGTGATFDVTLPLL